MLLKLPKHSRSLVRCCARMMFCCRELVKQGQKTHERAEQAKAGERTINFGKLDTKWFNQLELSDLQPKTYARPYSSTQGAIDSLAVIDSNSSGAWEAYLWQITVSKTHSVSKALFKVLDSLPAQVTSIVLCFVVPPEVSYKNWKWLMQLPNTSDCSQRVVSLMQTIRQAVLLLPKSVLENPKKSMSPPNTGSTTPEPDDDLMELE